MKSPGPRSYNAGAGLANVGKLAGWLRATMPPDDPSLSEQDAVNVAAYVDAQPRPDFDLEAHLPAPDGAVVYNSNVRKQVIRAPTWPPAPRGGPAAKPWRPAGPNETGGRLSPTARFTVRY